MERLGSLPGSSAAGTAGRPQHAAHLDRLQDMHSVIVLLVPHAGSVLTFTIVLLHLVLCCSNTTAPNVYRVECLLHEASSQHVYIPCCSDGWMAASVHLKNASHQHGWCKVHAFAARSAHAKMARKCGCPLAILAAVRAEATVISDPSGDLAVHSTKHSPRLCLLPSWPPPSLLPSWLARSSSCSSSMAPRANPAQP